MDVQIFDWKEFKVETLHEQIKSGVVGIGFQTKDLTCKVHGKVGQDKDRPGHWTVYAVFEKAGQTPRTMSRILKPEDAVKELEQSVASARQMVSRQAAINGS